MNVTHRVVNDTGFHTHLWASAPWAACYPQGIVPMAIGKEPNVSGVLNLFSYRKIGKTVVINPPFTQHCGLTIHVETEKNFGIITQRKKVLRALADYLDNQYSGAYIDIALPPEITDVQPFLKTGFTIGVGYTYRLNLTPGIDQLLSDFSPERRKNIRDSKKENFEILFDSDAEPILALVAQTFKNSGLHFDRDILKNIINSPTTFTVAVYEKKKLIAAAVIGFDHHTAFYLAGGTDKISSTAGALVLWEAVVKSREKGLKVFDFCGSSVPSIERFFRGFGGELNPFFRIKKNNKLFDLLKATKEKLDWI